MELSPDGDCLPPWSPLESDLPAEAHPWKKDLGIKSYHMPVFNSKAALSDLPKFQVCVLLGKDPRQLIKTGLWSLRSQVQMIGSCATFWDYKNGNSNNYWLDMRAKDESEMTLPFHIQVNQFDEKFEMGMGERDTSSRLEISIYERNCHWWKFYPRKENKVQAFWT